MPWKYIDECPVWRQDKNEGYKKGCDDYIIKPFSSDKLLSRISYLLE